MPGERQGQLFRRPLSGEYEFSDSTGVSILLGQGDGTFAAPSVIPSTYSIQVLATADFDGDGRPDLVAANGDTTISGPSAWTASIRRAAPRSTCA